MTAVESTVPLEYLLNELRDSSVALTHHSLRDASNFGRSVGGDVAKSPQYFVFRRGTVPQPRPVPQRRGATKYLVEPTRDCLILRCGGFHEGSGALVAGELLQPLNPSRAPVELFELYAAGLLRGFERVGTYWVGPQALGLRVGQRLVTMSIRSPREYDLRHA